MDYDNIEQMQEYREMSPSDITPIVEVTESSN